MSYEEGDEVVLSDEHSEFDGNAGTITQKMETMFGDATYTVNFEDGQEVGVAADQLDAAEDDSESQGEESVAGEKPEADSTE